ncbi:hypothetical protein F3J23_17195 [Chryseobacterium sp. Tr-659]|uniref:Ig-like domain-containing protein n=1 Tax=Chryseobacterium sp. Tr-659 TaxID=2608340 RepID=UPI00142419D5|nr:Ig-like domain-containing protein [Chryseobacterium sp. Tr-659]NIF07162.1 hypothetical protein [Chryseobacterium sp. Tr-659]
MKKNYSFHGALPCSKILIFLLILLFHDLSAQYGASDDFDGDGISNYDDIDDDNDGILDYIECQPASTIKRYNETGNAIWNGTTTITATRSNTTNITPGNKSGITNINRIITGSAPSVYTNNFRIKATRESFWLMNTNGIDDQRGSVTFTYSTPIPISEVLIVLQDVDYRTSGRAPTITITVSGGTATTQDLDAYKVGTLDLPNPNNTNNGGYNATTGVISYNVPLLGVGTNDDRAFALVGSSSATVKTIRVSYELDEKAEVYIGRIGALCDQDNDGISNNFDLDSDGDGCPDAVEAGVVDYAGASAMQSGSVQNGSNGAVTSTKTVVESVVSGPYGTNGFADSVEDNDTFAAEYKNTAGYTYSSAIDSGVVICCSNFTAGTLSGTQNICTGSNSSFSSTQSEGTWSSADTSIAIVSTTGVVTGVSAGTTTITYTYDKYNGSCPQTATRTVTVTLCSCYKPGTPATVGNPALISKVGVSSLLRNNSQQIQDNWPASRNGAWLVIEARTKGFVVNRMEFNSSGNPTNILPANFVEGMLVYDLTNKCLKMYTSQDSGVTFGWYCISTQTCPD